MGEGVPRPLKSADSFIEASVTEGSFPDISRFVSVCFTTTLGMLLLEDLLLLLLDEDDLPFLLEDLAEGWVVTSTDCTGWTF